MSVDEVRYIRQFRNLRAPPVLVCQSQDVDSGVQPVDPRGEPPGVGILRQLRYLGCPSDSSSSTLSSEKLPGFCLGGNSWNVARKFPT